jgi:hypothetical protein
LVAELTMADCVHSAAVTCPDVFAELDALRARSGLSSTEFALRIKEYAEELHPHLKIRRTQSAPGNLTPQSDHTDSATSVASLDSPIVDTVHSLMETAQTTKYDTFVYPSGDIHDFHQGLSERIGFPHLEFFAAMQQEHCYLAGANVEFTTRNYGIKTTPHLEWLYVVAAKADKPGPPADQLRHNREIPDVYEKMKCKLAIDARLRIEEIIALCLYTGTVMAFAGFGLGGWR